MVSKDFREILTAELLSVSGGLVAGTMLSFAVNKIYLIPGLLILLPGFLEMRGNISGSLSARLSAGLLLGVIKPKIRSSKIINGNIIASFVLVVILSLFLGIVAYATSYYFFGVYSLKIILVSIVAGMLSNLVEIPLTVATTFWLFSKGHDPNNVMGPYITTTGDIISIVSLLAAVVIA
jgi:mgtE-like transporter